MTGGSILMIISRRHRHAAIAVVVGLGIALSAPIASHAASSVTVSTSSGLKSALANAKPGTTITLRDGVYKGAFVATVSGTATSPITLKGSRLAVLSTGSRSSGYGLHLKAAHWKLTGFSVSTAKKGIMLDNADHAVIDGVEVRRTGHEGIHLRKGSARVTVRNSFVHSTGLETAAYGEGIYIGSAKSNWRSVTGSSTKPDPSNYAVITGNTISSTTAEGIDAKEGTVGGVISNNVFTNAGSSGANSADSWVDIKGNGYTVTGNSGSTARLDAFQVHSVVTGWGKNNAFGDNTVVSGVPGFEVNIAGASGLGNTVTCGATRAVKGLTNVQCVSAG